MHISDLRSLFSRSYAEARDKFLGAAARRRLPVETFELPLRGADGEALATDVVLDGPADASNLLIVISGVHGVEGYCGSAIQTGLIGLGSLGGLGGTHAAHTAVLHVHAVNPYGFSHSRRATQENVDLNRNFVDFSAALPVNAPYAEIHDLLLPPAWPPADANEAALDDYRQKVGPRGFQRAVALGQYAFADGMHYGGQEPAWSNVTFRRILRRYAAQCRQIGSIDIHTGLGPYGLGERIFACVDTAGAFDRARRWWGDQVTSVNTGSSASIPMTGPIQYALHEECPQAVQTNVCLEFGTYPAQQVIGAMRAEHWLHCRGSSDARQAASIRQTLKDAFYPQADDWQRDIWEQGYEVFLQTIRGLAESTAGAA